MAEAAEKRLKKLAKKSDKKLKKMTKFINKKSEKAIKKHLKDKKKEAKKAALEAAPGTSKLEKRLNIAGAKARARKAERQEKRGERKADREVKRDLRKSNRAVKRATIESMPGTSMLEKRLNYAGAKARARKADRQESKNLKKEGPLQQTSRKIDVSTVKNSPGSNSNLDSDLGKSYIKYYNVDKTPKDSETQQNTDKSETRVAFEKEFAAARSEGKDIFEFRGKKYNTKLKDKAKHGASLAIMIAPVKSKTKKVKAIKKGAKAQNGGKLTGPKKKNGKDKMKDLNLSDLVHRPSKNKDENWIMLASNPPKYRNTKTNEVISEDEYYKRTGKKKPEGGIKPLRK
jgi:hypothetical protein